jgi:acyl-CoA synthetase (AMP-forming)/AMP-acid ligase II
MGLYDFTIYGVINRNARCFGKKPAWLEVSDGREVTFGQLKDGVDHLAKGLQEAGLKKGDRVGVMGKNSLEYFLLFGAASALGLIVLPINWRLSAEEAGNNLADGGPRLVFADQEYQELIEGLKGKLTSVERYYNLSGGGVFKDVNELL